MNPERTQHLIRRITGGLALAAALLAGGCGTEATACHDGACDEAAPSATGELAGGKADDARGTEAQSRDVTPEDLEIVPAGWAHIEGITRRTEGVCCVPAAVTPPARPRSGFVAAAGQCLGVVKPTVQQGRCEAKADQPEAAWCLEPLFHDTPAKHYRGVFTPSDPRKPRGKGKCVYEEVVKNVTVYDCAAPC